MRIYKVIMAQPKTNNNNYKKIKSKICIKLLNVDEFLSTNHCTIFLFSFDSYKNKNNT